jgi:PadR family transcriptional regulator PadR
MERDLRNEYELNHRAFVILSLVSETPSHAYSINQRIDERGMRDWTEIGTSSIYNIINKLEEDKLVESYTKEVDNRIRKIYRITDFGFVILKNKVYKVISEFKGRRDPDYDIALSMYPLLSKEELIKAFRNSLEIIKNDIEILNKKEKISRQQSMTQWGMYPLNIKVLFVRPIKMMETHIEFINWMLEKIEEEKTPWSE